MQTSQIATAAFRIRVGAVEEGLKIIAIDNIITRAK